MDGTAVTIVQTEVEVTLVSVSQDFTWTATWKLASVGTGLSNEVKENMNWLLFCRCCALLRHKYHISDLFPDKQKKNNDITNVTFQSILLLGEVMQNCRFPSCCRLQTRFHKIRMTSN